MNNNKYGFASVSIRITVASLLSNYHVVRETGVERKSGSKVFRDRGIPMVVLRYSPDSARKWRTTAAIPVESPSELPPLENVPRERVSISSAHD